MVRNFNPILETGQGTQSTEGFTLYDVNERPYRGIDLTGAVDVRITVEPRDFGETVVNGESVTIPEATADQGYVEYTFSAEETRYYGRHYVQFEVEWSTGETELVPPSGYNWEMFVGRRMPRNSPLRAAKAYFGEASIGDLEVSTLNVAEQIKSLSVGELSPTSIRGKFTNGTAWRGIGGGLQFDADGKLYVSVEDYGTINGLTSPLTAPLPLNNYPIEGPGPVGTKTNPVDSATIEDVRRTESEWPRHMATTRAGSQLDGLNDLTNWTVTQGTAAIVGNGYYSGDAIQLTTASLETKTVIDREFATPQNFAEKDFTMAIRLDSVPGATGNSPRIILFDGSGNRQVYQTNIQTGAVGKWIRCSFGLETGFEEATVNLSNITGIRIQTGSPNDHQWTINDLRTVEKPEKGAVLFTFDDGNDTDFIHAFPILGKYGLSGSSFVNTGGIGGTGKMTWAQLETMQSRGWEVCSHGEHHDNLETLTEPEQRAHLSNARRDLRERGFWRGSRAHRTTHGGYDATSLGLMSQYFELGVAGGGGITGGTAAIGDSRLVRAQPCDDYARAKEVIRHTAEQRHLTVMTFHRIEDLDTAAFEDVVSTAKDYVDNDELDVLTVTDLLDPPIGYGVGPGSGGGVRRYADEGSFEASSDNVGIVATPAGDRLAWKTQ